MNKKKNRISKRGIINEGRSLIDIDEKVLEAMAGVGATTYEIADYFGCHETTIVKRFSAKIRKIQSGMKLRLRQAQYKTATGANGLPPNPTMQIWLGKQMLGQVDRAESTVDSTITIKIMRYGDTDTGEQLETQTLPAPVVELLREGR